MHQILRQIVDVDVQGDEAVALEVQRRVSAVCQHALGGHLETVLDTLDDAARHLVIDRLDVDLGAVRVEDLETALTTSLSSALARAMHEFGPGARAAVASSSPRRMGLSEVEALLQAVLHFLRHGRLPWWYERPEAGRLEPRLIALLAASAPGADARGPGAPLSRADLRAFVDELVRTLRSSAHARERLVRQFSATGVLALLGEMDEVLHGTVLRVLSSLAGPGPDRAPHGALETAVLEAALDLLGRSARRSGAGVADDLVRSVAERAAARSSAGERARLARSLGLELPPARGEEARSAAQLALDDAGAAGDGLLVENAGVVLLHAFLPRFLERTGIAKDGVLLRPSRALLLLHHLATGAPTAEEHELVLAKVLCGIPIEAPVAREPEVTNQERAEATALLEATVSHWDALRNTSPDALRGSFLTRPGRVELRETDWLLRVERQSFDVLLDHLPWGLGHVKLPWMPRLLQVEWKA